jgi:hypothetical protein
MISRRHLLLGVCFLSSLAGALELNFVGEPKTTLSASGIEVPVYARAIMPTEAGPVDLHLTGAGLLRSKVGPLKVSVYIATSYTNLVEGLDAEDPMTSIAEAHTRVLQLNLVRKLTGEQIRDAFRKSLIVNGVDPAEPAIDVIMKSLEDMPQGEVITLYGQDLSDKQRVTIETSKKSVVSEGLHIVYDIWSMWFGVPMDEYVAELKRLLVTPRFFW